MSQPNLYLNASPPPLPPLPILLISSHPSYPSYLLILPILPTLSPFHPSYPSCALPPLPPLPPSLLPSLPSLSFLSPGRSLPREYWLGPDLSSRRDPCALLATLAAPVGHVDATRPIVMTDLRMGHTPRVRASSFVVAEHDARGIRACAETDRLRSARPPVMAPPWLWNRIWDETRTY